MKSTLRKLTNGLLLVGMGFAVYYAGPVAHALLSGDRESKPLPTAPALANGPAGVEGNAYLQQALAALERRESVVAKASQTGVIEGRTVESTGDYWQLGQGRDRQFQLKLQGLVTDDPVRLLQVSNGKFLWTDLRWGEASDVQLRQIWRVDLRRLRKDLSDPQSDQVRPGEASADNLDAGLWASLGGLPMLLESLDANFRFERPRQMLLRKTPVYAMVGFWREDQRETLLQDSDTADTGLPSRLPHHVLVAIGASDLFPYRVEYRGADDPLSAAGLTADKRYGESGRPLLRLDLVQPRYDVSIPDEAFAYTLPEGVDWMDRTTERLEMLRRRREVAVAQAGGATSGARSR